MHPYGDEKKNTWHMETAQEDVCVEEHTVTLLCKYDLCAKQEKMPLSIEVRSCRQVTFAPAWPVLRRFTTFRTLRVF